MSKLMHIGEVISAFTNKIPDLGLLKHDYITHDHRLQEWIIEHLKPEFHWMTGIGVIEAANNIVKDAISNGNIK